MPQPQPKLLKRSALAKIAGVALASSAALAVFFSGGTARAVPVSRTPPPTSSPAATPTPADELPYNGSLMFVLDGTLSSTSSRKNDEVPVHLRDPLIVAGRTLAPAGTPSQIRVLDSRGAEAGDVYGYVEIFFEPLRLAGGQMLPLRAPVTRLTARLTAGHESTVGVEDTIGNIFIPYHPLYEAFRKGRNINLGPGAELRARTMADVRVLPSGAVAVAKPLPLPMDAATPHASFQARPVATPPGWNPPTPKPTPSPKPATSP